MEINVKEIEKYIISRIQDRMGEEYEVKHHEMTKNNGKKYSGVTIYDKEHNIAPTIYIDEYVNGILNNVLSIDQVVNEIIGIYENNRKDKNFNVDIFLKFETIKDKIIFELVNYEENRELFENVPCIKYHDLAILFRVLCTIDQRETGTVLITNAHIRLWEGITVDDLYEYALKNTPNLLGLNIRNIMEIVSPSIDAENLLEELDTKCNIPMYVATSKNGVKGAVCLLYPDLLKDFSNAIGSDLYILPSSVHEIILLPTYIEEDVNMLKRMVKEINHNEVDEEDRLSDHIYYYDKENETVKMY